VAGTFSCGIRDSEGFLASGSFTHESLISEAVRELVWVMVGLGTFITSDIRLRPGTIVCPDIIFGKLGMEAGVGEAADAALVVEVTSPSNFRWDRGPKRELYAAARIPWYLLAEPDMSDLSSVSLRLLRRDGRRYVEHASAQYGETLVSSEPFPISVDTTLLLEP